MSRGKYKRKKAICLQVTHNNKVLDDFAMGIFKRDKHICLMCGNQFNDNNLVLYYDTRSGSKAKDETNIITLCKKCNQKVHEGSIWGKTEKGIPIMEWWNKEDIIRMRIVNRQVKNIPLKGLVLPV